MKNLLRVVGILLFSMMVMQLSFAQGRKGNPGPEARAKRQSEHLFSQITSFSEDQKSKIQEINLRYAKLMQEKRQSNQEDREAMRAEMKALRKQKREEFKAIMTEEQYGQYVKLQKEQGKGNRGRKKGRGKN
ncbi:hypothetical protein AAG747_19985 [Rapidithrix thailandica]|uniref:DUF4890 domain-containing protein n=1 Tax=Rapidithrix thailandica TaxID=413964 RepID=A0AAW9SHA1_9BACT